METIQVKQIKQKTDIFITNEIYHHKQGTAVSWQDGIHYYHGKGKHWCYQNNQVSQC